MPGRRLEPKGYETSHRTLLLPSAPVLVCMVIALARFRLASNLLRWGTPIRHRLAMPDFMWH